MKLQARVGRETSAIKEKSPGRYGGTGRGEHLMRLGGLLPASAKAPE
jgi:hypothetical protein